MNRHVVNHATTSLAMNAQALWILLVPLLGLLAIFRDGKFHWDPFPPAAAARLRRLPLIYRLLVGMFWLGWMTCLVVGILMLLGVMA